MLETYLSSARTGDAELRSVTEAPMPTRAEDVDKFMAELVCVRSPPHAVTPYNLTTALHTHM